MTDGTGLLSLSEKGSYFSALRCPLATVQGKGGSPGSGVGWCWGPAPGEGVLGFGPVS